MTGTLASTAGLLAAIEDTYGRFGALLAGLDEAAWAVAVPGIPGWPPTWSPTSATASASPSPAWKAPPGELPVDDVDAWTAAQVAAHKGEPPELLLQDVEAAADAFRWQLAALDRNGWRARTVWVAGPLSVRSLAQLRLHETWVHGHDVAEAVDRAWPADLATVAWMADLAASRACSTDPLRARPGAAILLRLHPTGEWLVGGAAGHRPDPGTEPDLVIEADALEFVLLSARRRRWPPWVAGRRPGPTSRLLDDAGERR